RRHVQPERDPEDLAPLQQVRDLVGVHPLTDAEVLAQDLAERPVRDPVSVCEAATGANDGWRFLSREDAPQLLHEPRLPHTWLADEGNEMRLRLRSSSPVGRPKQVELALATDEHARKPTDPSRPACSGRAEDGRRDNAPRLPLRLHRPR